MSLKNVAQETLEIVEKGQYTNSRGEIVDFLEMQRYAVAGTLLYRPEQGHSLLKEASAYNSPSPIQWEVTQETTQEAAYRMVEKEKVQDLVLLNYASARNPGGGFLNGAKAQEEDLARCSGLYPCLLTQPEYYESNRNQNSLLYTDHIIYSPKVPWFRIQNSEFLDRVFLASVITAPAPNAGQLFFQQSYNCDKIEAVLRQRAGIILAIARKHEHRSLLLGAWGCGAFSNDPDMVADAFGRWLESPNFQGCFDRVTFAIYGRSTEKNNWKAFDNRFKKV